MILDPYTPAFIIGVMATCIIVVGLIGVLFGLMGLFISRSAFRLGVYGSYTGSIPGGVIGYVASSGTTTPLTGFIYALVGGGLGAVFGAIAGISWLLVGQRYRSAIRRRFSDLGHSAVPTLGTSPPSGNNAESGAIAEQEGRGD